MDYTQHFNDETLKQIKVLVYDSLNRRRNKYLTLSAAELFWNSGQPLRIALYPGTDEEIAEGIITSHLHSSAETKFGELFEKISVLVTQGGGRVERLHPGPHGQNRNVDARLVRSNASQLIQAKSGPKALNGSSRRDLERSREEIESSGCETLKTVCLNNPADWEYLSQKPGTLYAIRDVLLAISREYYTQYGEPEVPAEVRKQLTLLVGKNNKANPSLSKYVSHFPAHEIDDEKHELYID